MGIERRAPVAVDQGTEGVALARALGAGGAWPASGRVCTVRAGHQNAYRAPSWIWYGSPCTTACPNRSFTLYR